VAVLVGLALGGLLAWLSGDPAVAPAILLTLGIGGFVVYGLTALRARPILTYALSQTGSSLGRLLPMATRALPLLLVFMTFLFINAEVWMMSAYLDGASLWVTVLLFLLLGLLFFVTRLPEEIERADDDLDDERVVLVCRGTPMEAEATRLAKQTGLLAQESHVVRYERANLTLVLAIRQLVQVLVLSLSVFVFFLLFGSLVMEASVQLAWTQLDHLTAAPYLSNVSTSLLKVSLFLASFSGFYFTVSAVTDDTYRRQFFSVVESQLERAVGMRAVYLATRARD
jgi:hypothetical protein